MRCAPFGRGTGAGTDEDLPLNPFTLPRDLPVLSFSVFLKFSATTCCCLFLLIAFYTSMTVNGYCKPRKPSLVSGMREKKWQARIQLFSTHFHLVFSPPEFFSQWLKVNSIHPFVVKEGSNYAPLSD